MILVYVTNEKIGEVRDMVFDGRISYRNPKYWKGEVEKCTVCYVHEDYPKIKQAYEGKLIEPQKDSTDYTIAELRDMKDSVEDWQAFTANDNRKSISQL